MEPADISLDTAPCGFVSFTDDGAVTYVNLTLCERLGYTRAELVNRHVEAIFSKPGRLFFQTHLFPLVKMHGRAEEIFLLLRSKSGEEIGAICNAVQQHRDGTVVTDCVFSKSASGASTRTRCWRRGVPRMTQTGRRATSSQ